MQEKQYSTQSLRKLKGLTWAYSPPTTSVLHFNYELSSQLTTKKR